MGSDYQPTTSKIFVIFMYILTCTYIVCGGSLYEHLPDQQIQSLTIIFIHDANGIFVEGKLQLTGPCLEGG